MYALYLSHFDDPRDSIAAIFDYKPSVSQLFEFIRQEYSWTNLSMVQGLMKGKTITDTGSFENYTYSLSLREINTLEWL